MGPGVDPDLEGSDAARTNPSPFLTTWSSSSLTAVTSPLAGRRDPTARLVLEAGVLRLAQDHPLVDQLVERLGRADVTPVEQDFVPEPAVEQVQDRMLGAPT